MDMPASRTLPRLLSEMAGRYPDRSFLTDGVRRMSYAEFLAEARSMARGFHALGVRKGDKVAVLMGNQLEWLLTQFAVTMLGGVLVALNTWWRQAELRHALALSDASVLVMVDRYLGNDYAAELRQIGDLALELPKLKHVVCLGDHGPAQALSWPGLRRMGETVPVALVDAAAREAEPGDPAMMLFTSGSTARSKAVPLAHRGLIENMHAIGERMYLSEEDRLLLVISLFWALGGVNALFTFMTHGASIVLQHHHDPAETLRLIEAERCTAIYTTPNIVFALHGHPDRKRRDLSTLRTGVARNTAVHLMHEMGAREMCPVYGLTECYANATVADARAPLEVRRRSSGFALPNTEVQIVDPGTRAPLAQGEVGEVRVRGYVTSGYCKNPELTAAAIDREGWFYTGDLARLDAEGGLQFQGRLKELIKTGGINVAPADVESLLLDFPGVDQAFAVGVPDLERDEVIAAMVVPRAGCSVTAADLVEHCRRSAAAYKVPRHIELVEADQVPLTDAGKVHKRRIRELLGAKYLAARGTPGES